MAHKSSNNFLFTIKRSEYRNTIAKCLKCWKKNKSLRGISKTLNLHRHTVTEALRRSRFFKEPKYKAISSLSNQMLIKNSPYRKEIAKCINIWRINRSLLKTASVIGYGKDKTMRLLKKSRFYTERISISQTDRTYIQKWSNKIQAINLLGGQCHNCGNKNIFVLDFHHFKNNKKKNIGKLLNSKWTSIVKELKKCIILCRNCHQELHHNKKIKRKDIKKYLMSLISNQKCSCGYDKIQGLTFHHKPGTKKFFTISSSIGIKNKKSMSKLITEVKKCEILCGNCHKLKHIKHEKFRKLKFLILRKFNQTCPS